MMNTKTLVSLLLLLAGMLFGFGAFGRGESWIARPKPPPARETLTNAARYVEWKWRMDVTDPSTGIGNAEATKRLMKTAKDLEPKEPWCVVKATCFDRLCRETSIDVSPLDWFPTFALWNRHDRPMCHVTGRRNAKVARRFYPEILGRIGEGNRTGRWAVWKDFDHIIPEWDEILVLGFPGLKRRLRANWKETPFYRACDIAADATLAILDRLVAQGERNLARPQGDAAGRRRLEAQVASLKRLRKGAPETAYDAMQFIYVYFVLSEHFDGIQCRSLSVIDHTLADRYRRDLAAGRTTEAEFREQFAHFLWQWGSIDNYWGQPITMGGTKADGSSEYDEVSRILLEVMDACALPTPKFHLKIAANTPKPILRQALDMARRHRPLSFIGEGPIRKVLEGQGYSADDARGFVTKGCYEFCVPKDGNGLGGGHPNLVKIVEEMLSEAAAGTYKAETFAAFKADYLKRLAATCEEVMGFFLVFEKHLDDVNSANFPSLAGKFSVERGLDRLSTGTPSGNETSILLSGFGTAVDALMAVREIVYERREMTLAELGGLMAKNWQGRDDLRLRMLRSPRKWGNNDSEANALGREISKVAAATINGKPNSRNGLFRMSGHNARQFVCEGAVTGATPDGRRRGEEFSKNLSPTMGADTEGVTALVQTLASLDSSDFPADFPLDVMLVSHTVSGAKGLDMMTALLDAYFANGGFMMQFNVFDAGELRDAQAHPERYENLQVRVCGWNVRWNDLPKKEQDAYILRAERVMQ